ncbi:hypothetical protein KKD62_04055 [Patescibacteria group bacterium]|nr:hypothetical protein [Patescibacteria group bacterium]MBU1931568.1 hypothetical protein [Patescibacteria group bacterium]
MDYIKDINKARSKCNRIIGLQKLSVSGLKIPSPIKIIEPLSFEHYRNSKKFSKELKAAITAAFLKIRAKNPHRGVYAGRAYFVPGIKHPPGPRSSSVKSGEIILKEVKKLFEFAIKNKFDQKGSEIGVILYPFINPKIPFGGGCITPSLKNKNLAVIEAIFGVDEGVQSFPHDTYIVDFHKKLIISRKVEIKSRCLQVSSELEYQTMAVPKQLQATQVLRDEQIFKITADFRRFTNKYGLHRLEFAVQPEGIYFRECVIFKPVKVEEKGLKIKASVLRISKPEDIKKIKQNNRVIFIDPQIIRKRNMDLLTSLAFNIVRKKIILYPGSASTAHAATILRERGHILVFVGKEIFKSGQKVDIGLKRGQLAVLKKYDS